MDLLNDNFYKMLPDDFATALTDEQFASLDSYSLFDEFLQQADEQIDDLNPSLNESFNSDLYSPLSPPQSTCFYDSLNDCSSSILNWVIFKTFINISSVIVSLCR